MNVTTTRWLAGLALAMLLYVVFWDSRTTDTTDRLDARTRVLPGLEPRQVQGLEIRREGQLVLALERAEDGWRLTQPLPFPARAASVDNYLNALRDLRFRSLIEPKEVLAQTNGLAAYGLAQPAALVTVRSGERTWELRLGGRSPIGGQVYAQATGHDGVLAVPDSILRLTPVSSFPWRSTALVSLGVGGYDRIQVLPATNGFELVRNPSNQTWRLTRPLDIRADSARIEYLLRQLEMTQVAGFVNDRPTPADLARYGLAPPVAEWILSRGAERLAHLQIGAPATNNTELLHVRDARIGHIVLVGRKALEPWLTGFRLFCDRRMMVFNPAEVRALEFEAAEPVAVRLQTNGQWRIVRPYDAPADRALVYETLAALAGLEFVDFEREVTTDFATFGLEPPLRHYRVLGAPTNAPPNATNRLLGEVRLGRPKGTLILARRGTENSVVTVLDRGQLPTAAWQLRDRQIWNVSTNDIAAITVFQQVATKKLIREGPLEWRLAEGSVGGFTPVTIEETAYQLGHLRAERWVASGAQRLSLYGFQEAGCRIDLELKPREGVTPKLSLWLGRRSPSGRRYAAVQMGQPPDWVVFELPESTQIFIEQGLLFAPLP